MNKTVSFTCHPSAIVESNDIGDGTHIGPFTVVEPGTHIGKNCLIGQGCHIQEGSRIGDGVHISNGVSIWRGVFLDSDVFVGPQVVFTNLLNPRAYKHPATPQTVSQTRVGRGVSIGANATILCGHIIGPYASIGAGSTMTHSVRAHEILVGNPARHHGWACECGEPLLDVRHCIMCGRGYEMIDTGLRPLNFKDSN